MIHTVALPAVLNRRRYFVLSLPVIPYTIVFFQFLTGGAFYSIRRMATLLLLLLALQMARF
jgi:hypothetical protein